jgi:hypothetical protein
LLCNLLCKPIILLSLPHLLPLPLMLLLLLLPSLP